MQEKVAGPWQLTVYVGKEWEGEDTRPWVFSGNQSAVKLETYDAKNRRALLDIAFFNSGKALFCDIFPGDSDRQDQDSEILELHMIPCHSVAKVFVTPERLKFFFLNFEWLESELEKGNVKLRRIETETHRLLLFDEPPETWKSFLLEHGDNPEAFPEKTRIELIRPNPAEPEPKDKALKSPP